MKPAGAAETEPEIVEDPGETVTVDDTDDGGEPEAGAGGADGAGDRPTRAQRRLEEARTVREAREAREASDARYTALERQFQEQGRALAEVRGYLASQRQQQQQGDPAAKLNADLERLYDDADRHLERAALARQAKDPETSKKEMRLFYAKTREAAELSAEARISKGLDERFRQVQQAIPNQQMHADRERLTREFPWMYSNRGAVALADSIIDEMVHKGHPMAYETFRVALTEAAKQLRIGGQQASTQQQRQRFVAPAGGEGSGGSDGGAPQIIMTRENKRLAHLTYKNLEPKDAEKKWAKEMAKRMKETDE